MASGCALSRALALGHDRCSRPANPAARGVDAGPARSDPRLPAPSARARSRSPCRYRLHGPGHRVADEPGLAGYLGSGRAGELPLPIAPLEPIPAHALKRLFVSAVIAWHRMTDGR